MTLWVVQLIQLVSVRFSCRRVTGSVQYGCTESVHKYNEDILS